MDYVKNICELNKLRLRHRIIFISLIMFLFFAVLLAVSANCLVSLVFLILLVARFDNTSIQGVSLITCTLILSKFKS